MLDEKVMHQILIYFLKYGLIIILALYFVFALIIRQQVRSMKKTLITPIGKHITILSHLHLLVTLIILAIVIYLI